MVMWNFKLAEYNVRIKHMADKEKAVSDALSRTMQGCVKAVEKVKVCGIEFKGTVSKKAKGGWSATFRFI